jgi:hypothetical protein
MGRTVPCSVCHKLITHQNIRRHEKNMHHIGCKCCTPLGTEYTLAYVAMYVPKTIVSYSDFKVTSIIVKNTIIQLDKDSCSACLVLDFFIPPLVAHTCQSDNIVAIHFHNALNKLGIAQYLNDPEKNQMYDLLVNEFPNLKAAYEIVKESSEVKDSSEMKQSSELKESVEKKESAESDLIESVYVVPPQEENEEILNANEYINEWAESNLKHF